MALLLNDRSCATCSKPMPIVNNEGTSNVDMQEGWYCCDEYFCSDVCLNKSFEGTGETWDEHYDEGDCYWSQWELEFEEVK